MAENSKLEYDYKVINDVAPTQWEVTGLLRKGWTVDRAIPTSQSVHYILVRETPSQTGDNPAGADDAPIDLTDVPF